MFEAVGRAPIIGVAAKAAWGAAYQAKKEALRAKGYVDRWIGYGPQLRAMQAQMNQFHGYSSSDDEDEDEVFRRQQRRQKREELQKKSKERRRVGTMALKPPPRALPPRRVSLYRL
jgi:hypothetical protein